MHQICLCCGVLALWALLATAIFMYACCGIIHAERLPLVVCARFYHSQWKSSEQQCACMIVCRKECLTEFACAFKYTLVCT